jgi:hypothetical protein
MQKSHALPFELTPESVSTWLVSIDRLFLTEKINLLNGVLNELAKAEVEKNTLFSMLDNLTENVLLLAKLLEHNAKRKDYPPEKAKKWKNAAMQLPKKLGFAYAQLASESSLPDRQKAICLYRAMQILGLLSKRTTIFHELPDFGVWKKFAELYLLAEARQWLSLAIEDRIISGLIAQPTIDAVAKHVLLFHGCHPNRYSASDIAAVFAATTELAQFVRLVPEASGFTLSHWQPDALLPPECIDPENPEQRMVSLDNSELVDFFENHPDQQARFATYPGLLNRLTAYYEIRRTVNPSAAQKCGLITGNSQAAKFLNVLISRYRVMELSGTNQSHRTASSLELVPLEMRNTMASLSSKTLADIKNVSVSQLTIFATKERAFRVVKVAHLKCSQDEPAILVQEGLPPCFALIRHIRTDSNIKFRNLLLEKIDGEVYPVEIEKKQGFIIIRPESDRAELFLPPECRYTHTTILAISRGIIDASLKIEKFMELSLHFARYRVSFC